MRPLRTVDCADELFQGFGGSSEVLAPAVVAGFAPTRADGTFGQPTQVFSWRNPKTCCLPVNPPLGFGI